MYSVCVLQYKIYSVVKLTSFMNFLDGNSSARQILILDMCRNLVIEMAIFYVSVKYYNVVSMFAV